jgi:hypothetical protein
MFKDKLFPPEITTQTTLNQAAKFKEDPATQFYLLLTLKSPGGILMGQVKDNHQSVVLALCFISIILIICLSDMPQALTQTIGWNSSPSGPSLKQQKKKARGSFKYWVIQSWLLIGPGREIKFRTSDWPPF